MLERRSKRLYQHRCTDYASASPLPAAYRASLRPILPCLKPTTILLLPDWDLKNPAITDNRPDCELNYAPSEGGC